MAKKRVSTEGQIVWRVERFIPTHCPKCRLKFKTNSKNGYLLDAYWLYESQEIAEIISETGIAESVVRKICTSQFEKIFKNLEQCQTVTIENFGTFYIKVTEPTRTFKFNPSKRLRGALGWSAK